MTSTLMANENTGKSRVGRREIFFVFALLVGLTTLTIYYSVVPQLPKEKLVGQPAPPIEFELAGKRQSLESVKGSVIFVNFWAAWCEPCMEEMPSLHMMETHFARRNFILLAFNMDEEGENVRGKIPRTGIPDNLIFNFSKQALASYGVSAIPLSVVINRFGVVRRIYQGPRNWMDFAVLSELEEILKE